MFLAGWINKGIDQPEHVELLAWGGGKCVCVGAVCLECGLWNCVPRSMLTINTQLSGLIMWNCGEIHLGLRS